MALTASLVSLLSGRVVRDDTAMTGEITLVGKVLPVGGIKEKVLAAKRAGITRIVMPERNATDLEDLTDEARKDMAFHFVKEIREALDLVLQKRGRPATTAKRTW